MTPIQVFSSLAGMPLWRPDASRFELLPTITMIVILLRNNDMLSAVFQATQWVAKNMNFSRAGNVAYRLKSHCRMIIQFERPKARLQ